MCTRRIRHTPTWTNTFKVKVRDLQLDDMHIAASSVMESPDSDSGNKTAFTLCSTHMHAPDHHPLTQREPCGGVDSHLLPDGKLYFMHVMSARDRTKERIHAHFFRYKSMNEFARGKQGVICQVCVGHKNGSCRSRIPRGIMPKCVAHILVSYAQHPSSGGELYDIRVTSLAGPQE